MQQQRLSWIVSESSTEFSDPLRNDGNVFATIGAAQLVYHSCQTVPPFLFFFGAFCRNLSSSNLSQQVIVWNQRSQVSIAQQEWQRVQRVR